MGGEGRVGKNRAPALTHRHISSVEGTGGTTAGGGEDIELGTPHTHASRVADEEAHQIRSLLRQSSPEPGDGGPGHGGARGKSMKTHGDSRRSPSSSEPVAAFKAKGRLAAWLDSLSPRLKFAILVGCVMLFFGLHNILQEAIFAMEGFSFGWSLGMIEAVGVLAGSMLERAHLGDTGKRVAPFQSYVLLAGLLGMSSSLSNIALKYIKYPTKVIFRSCKLIPTMAIAVVWRKKIVSRWEFMAAFAVCTGLIVFAQADAKLEPDFDPRGIAMVMLSVCADAFLPNLQEHVFSMGASRVEVTFFTNSLTVLGMILSTTANGNLLEFLRYTFSHQSATLYMLAYATLSHVAIAAHMMVLKEYGGVTAVLVGITRKSMTIALSFLLFPKPFSYHFLVGGGLVLGGLAANVKIKERRKGATGAASKSHAILPDLENGSGGTSSGGTGSGGTGGGGIGTVTVGGTGGRGSGGGGGGKRESRSASDAAAAGTGGGASAGVAVAGGNHQRYRRDDGVVANGHASNGFAVAAR